jgi:hypothetical protein
LAGGAAKPPRLPSFFQSFFIKVSKIILLWSGVFGKIENMKKFSQKRVFRKKNFFLPKTSFRVRNVAARLEHRRVEGKRKK